MNKRPFRPEMEIGEVLEEVLTGAIELVVNDEGHHVIVEHKTSSKKWDVDQPHCDIQARSSRSTWPCAPASGTSGRRRCPCRSRMHAGHPRRRGTSEPPALLAAQNANATCGRRRGLREIAEIAERRRLRARIGRARESCDAEVRQDAQVEHRAHRALSICQPPLRDHDSPLNRRARRHSSPPASTCRQADGRSL